MCDSIYGVIWGVVCGSGAPPACLSTLCERTSCRLGVGHPEVGFLGWKPLSLEALMRVLPATLAHLSPGC